MSDVQEQTDLLVGQDLPELDPALVEMADHVRLGEEAELLDDDGNSITGIITGVRFKDDGSGLDIELAVPKGLIQSSGVGARRRDPQYLYEDERRLT